MSLLSAFVDELEKVGAAPRSFPTPQSSNVQGFRYDAKTQQLYVTYKSGGTYRYSGVPPNVFKSMRRNKSVGKTIHKRVKGGGYAYEKVSGVAIDVETREPSAKYPVVTHTFKGKTEAEARGYMDSHKKTDRFFRECFEGKMGDVECENSKVVVRKIAAAGEEWRSGEEHGKALTAELVGFLAQLGLSASLIPVMSKWKKEDVPESTRRVNQMAREMNLPAKSSVRRGSPAFAGTVQGLGGKILGPIVHLPERAAREAIIAHELGHYKNRIKFSPRYHKVQDASRLLTGGVSGRMAVSALVGSIAAGTETPSYVPAAIGGAVAAPVLFEEAAASVRGTKHMMKRHGKIVGALRSLGLLPAFATYLAPALIPALITRARKKYRAETGATKKDRMRESDWFEYEDEDEDLDKAAEEATAPSTGSGTSGYGDLLETAGGQSFIDWRATDNPALTRKPGMVLRDRIRESVDRHINKVAKPKLRRYKSKGFRVGGPVIAQPEHNQAVMERIRRATRLPKTANVAGSPNTHGAMLDRGSNSFVDRESTAQERFVRSRSPNKKSSTYKYYVKKRREARRA